MCQVGDQVPLKMLQYSAWTSQGQSQNCPQETPPVILSKVLNALDQFFIKYIFEICTNQLLLNPDLFP